MKNARYLLLLLPFLLVGQGCTTTTTIDSGEENGDAMMEESMEEDRAMEEDSEAMMEEKDGEAMEEDEEAMEEGEEVSFDVSGVNFAFDMEEIRVNEGDTVTINFTSDEGFHDWVVDEFDAATEQVNTGGSTSVTFVADEAGEYEYYCSVGNHRAQGMVGTLIVE